MAANIGFVIVSIIVIWILMSVISIRLNYKPFFDWWKQNNGVTYDKFFNLFTMLSSHESNIIFAMSKIIGNIFTSLNRSQVLFIGDVILPHTRLSIGTSDPTRNFLLPRHLCSNICFAAGEDAWFDEYTKANSLDPTVVAKYDNNGNLLNNGVYPSPNDQGGWMSKFKEWGAAFQYDKTLGWMPKNATDPGVIQEWFNIQKHPDNFLSRYSIYPDSPLTIFFVNNTYTDPTLQIKFDPRAFMNLVGGNSPNNPGGWIGFLESLGDGFSNDQYQTLLFSEYKPKNPPPPIKCTRNKTTTGFMTGLTTIFTAGPVLAMLSGPAAIGAGIAILAGGITAGVGAASSSSC